MANRNVLEVCCGSLQSAVKAVAGGAERIELCSALEVDGLTPSMQVLRELRQRYPALRIHVLIRPREGDFVYSEAEVAQMEREIHEAMSAGATAIVCGALTAEGEVDVPATKRLVEAAEGLPFTFHRAFDVVKDWQAALETLRALGIQRVLTSGGAATAEEGIAVLRQLVTQAGESLTILPGGGVNRRNARRIIKETGATEIHGSCSEALPDGQRLTSTAEVAAVLEAINRLTL